jgi:hypothetical protein
VVDAHDGDIRSDMFESELDKIERLVGKYVAHLVRRRPTAVDEAAAA